MSRLNSEQVAKLFHDTYERLAPEHGYKTRKASAVPWEDVPEKNRALMIATCKIVIAEVEGHKGLDRGSTHGKRQTWQVKMKDSCNWMFRFESTTRWYDARAEALRIMRDKGIYDVAISQIEVVPLRERNA